MVDKYFEDNCFESVPDISLLTGGEFISCRFEGLDLGGMNLNYSIFSECIFKGCNLSNTSLSGATFREVEFDHSKIIGVNFSHCSSLFEITFRDCILDYAIFQGSEISYFKALASSLKEADFSEAKLIKSQFNGSNLLNANFSASDLMESDFRDAKNYFINPRFSSIKKAKFSMPEAMSLLSAFDITVE